MASGAKPVISAQVREVIDFALRHGDLGSEQDFVGPSRAREGILGHQRLQRSRPEGYEKEVKISHEVDAGEFRLRVMGRIDGLLVTEQEVLLEEIKTVRGKREHIAQPLHWAQAKFYGYMYAHDHGLERIRVRLAYLDLETEEVTEFTDQFSVGELAAFFEEATAIYLEWVREQFQWRRRRDEALRELAFPFPQYRPGQRTLAVAAYRAVARGERLFLAAPTGLGKTMSVLFPALKAMGEGKLERIFYLTARTLGRTVAEKALADLRQAQARPAHSDPGAGVRPSSGAATAASPAVPGRSNAPANSKLAAPEDGRTPAPGSECAKVRLRTLTLTAKEKICFQQGQPCDALNCPFAQGYYDQRKPAMRDALGREEITRPVLEEVGRRHQVCPFELGLDLSSWVDVVVCDYNYVFDPKVYLRRHFGEEAGDYAFLVDEAHNLVDRAREMFSADLESEEIREVRRSIKERVPKCARALGKLNSALRKLGGPAALAAEPAEVSDPRLELNLFPAATAGTRTAERAAGGVAQLPRRDYRSGTQALRGLPAELVPLLQDALKEAEAWLAQNQPAEFRESLLALYFRLFSFRRVAEDYDERFVTLVETGASMRVRLYCLDPSFRLREALARGKAAVFFSATLTPLDYYRKLLGGSPEDRAVQLPSPFPPENLAVLVQSRVRTDYKARAGTLAEVGQAIGALVRERRGNYLAYFPSYQYLTAVQEQFQALYPAVSTLVQRPGMTEPEREAFLAAFGTEHDQTLLGFAVMGGIFGEGIDLVGDRLIGAVVVGVGLPQLCMERDLVRDYFQEKTGAGFDYAYTFPGMNRVLQATGRVIRTETDRGIVLLIDARFAEPRYRRLFPSWWRPVLAGKVGEIQAAAGRFWGETRNRS